MDNPAGEAGKEILLRLRRIEGQVRGLAKMIAAKRECDEVVVQLAAIRAALEKVSMSIVGAYVVECIAREIKDKGGYGQAMEKAKELFWRLSADNPAEEAEKEIMPRLQRIEGQVRDLAQMVAAKRECDEIVAQLAAIRAALEKVSMSIVGAYVVECIAQEIENKGDCAMAMEKAKELFLKLS